MPGRYGGFETLAEQLLRRLPADRYDLTIYCQRSAYPDERHVPRYFGHRRVFMPLRANGWQSILHDTLAILHAALFLKAKTILVLGYSGALILPVVALIRPSLCIATNIDGMEWRRAKFSRAARVLLRAFEAIAVRCSDTVIADNPVLVDMVQKMYGVRAQYIAYGGDHTRVATVESAPFPPGYYLSMSRVEPENNCHLILDAFQGVRERLVYIGNWQSNEYGRALYLRHRGSGNVTLSDPIYDQSKLAPIRARAIGYIHGHSVGGTNPSLVEALFHTDRIAAFECAFNRATLCGKGAYFEDADSLRTLIGAASSCRIDAVELQRLRERYSWHHTVDKYAALLFDS